MYKKPFHIILIALVAGIFANCSGSPLAQPIASYPKITPISQYPPQYAIVYRGYMEFRVTDTDKAADRATRFVYDYGGFLTNSQSWYVDGRKVTTLEMAVPSSNFDQLRQALFSLGDLESESFTGEIVDPYVGAKTRYSFITLQLRPGGSPLPPIEPSGSWNPSRTLQRAWTVFVSVFGFLADILIWVVVVAGPFIVVALGANWAFRRFRRRP